MMAKYYGAPRGAHHIKSIDWWTPPEIFAELNLEFDIDVAAPKGGVDWLPSKKFYTKEDDGLSKKWEGRVWMNPPYGKYTQLWLEKFIDHGNGIALVFNRTDTRWFHNYVTKSDAILFGLDRIHFYNPREKKFLRGTTGSLFVACGKSNANALKNSNLGYFINLKNL